MFSQVNKAFVKTIIFTFHVSMFDENSQYVFVETACEVAFKKFIVVNGFGDNSANEFVITQVIRIAVRRRVDHVSYAIARADGKQRVHGIKNFP